MTRYSKTMRDALNEVYLVEKVDKKLALKILSMMKNQKFVKVSGDFVPEIYLSGMDRDALKKEFGRLPRGLPNASNGVPVVDFINYALGLDNEIDTEDGDKPQPKLYDYRKGKVIGKPKTVGDAAKMAGLRLEGMEYEEEEIFDEWVEIDEMKMNDPKLVRKFDKLKRGDTVKLKTSSTISKGTDFVDYVVKAKNTVNKGRVEKITLVTKGNEKAVKKFLYKRDGKVTFAIGDMGASIDDIKEKLGKDADAGDYIDDFKKSDAPQFKGKSDKKKRDMAIAAYLDAKDKKEEVDEGMKYTHAAVDKKGLVIGFASDEKDAKDMARRNDGKVVKLKKPMLDKKGDMMVNRPFKEEVELDEVTMSKALDIDPKDVDRMKTLAVLYTRAMKLPAGSPKQDKFKKEIEKLRKELGMSESVFKELVKSVELDEKVKEYKGVAYFKTRKDAEEHMKKFAPKGRVVEFGRGYAVQTKISGPYLNKSGKTEEVELDEAKYDLYHKDFSSAMQHAYAMAKKLHGITIDPKEIDNKVATGPRKPGTGKTNTYRLKGDKGNIQIQVYNKGGSKPFELNMYKEEVELDEGKMKDLLTKGQDLEAYAKKHGGIDKKDMMKVAAMLKKGDKSGALKYTKRMDTDPRDYILDLMGEEDEKKPDKPDSAKAVDQARDDKKKTRIAQLQLQIAKASEMINKLNSQEKPDA